MFLPGLIANIYPIRLLTQVLKGDVFACVSEKHSVFRDLLVQEHIGRPEVQRTGE